MCLPYCLDESTRRWFKVFVEPEERKRMIDPKTCIDAWDTAVRRAFVKEISNPNGLSSDSLGHYTAEMACEGRNVALWAVNA